MTRLKQKSGSEEGNEASDVKELFPFHVYFSNAPQPIFKGMERVTLLYITLLYHFSFAILNL